MRITGLGWAGLLAGGAAGTLLRYLVALAMSRPGGGTFPWATLAINVSGCLAIGFVAGHVDRGAHWPAALRVAVMVGLLGGFTTFSSFGLETLRLLEESRWGAAAAYVAASNLLGLAAVWAGYRMQTVL